MKSGSSRATTWRAFEVPAFLLLTETKKTWRVTKEPKFNTHDSEFRTPLPLHIYNMFVNTEWMMWVILFPIHVLAFQQTRLEKQGHLDLRVSCAKEHGEHQGYQW